MYIVAYYYQKPKHNRIRTAQPGWMKVSGNTAWDEQVTVTKKLRNKDISTSKIILDLVNKRVVKNDWGGSREFVEMFKYFRHSYPQYNDIMRTLDPEFMNFHFPDPTPVPDSEIKTIDTSGSISSINS